MRQERARRLLESNKGDDFRTGCGTLPDGLRDRVCALEALAVIGAELYRQRKVEAVRGPWLQEPGRMAVVAKPSKNKSRRIGARRLKELERRQKEGEARVEGPHPVECVVLEEVDEGVEESKESNPEPLAHNVASVVRPEMDDVPGAWCDSESEEDERPSR